MLRVEYDCEPAVLKVSLFLMITVFLFLFLKLLSVHTVFSAASCFGFAALTPAAIPDTALEHCCQ